MNRRDPVGGGDEDRHAVGSDHDQREPGLRGHHRVPLATRTRPRDEHGRAVHLVHVRHQPLFSDPVRRQRRAATPICAAPEKAHLR